MTNDQLCTDPNEITNFFLRFFDNNKIIFDINPSLLNEQIYLHSLISFTEINRFITKCSSQAPRPVGIPYICIHNLATSALELIVKIYNKISLSGQTPQNWEHSIIIPTLKPGKNKYELNTYGSITLLNSMVKIPE